MVSDVCDVDLVGYAERADSAVVLIAVLCQEVIILDLQLSAGSGLDVLREVRRLIPAAVVLVLTAYASHGNRQAYLQMEADLFFDKCTEMEKAIDTLCTLQPEVGMIWNSSAHS